MGASVLVMALCASTVFAADFAPTFSISGFGQILYTASQAAGANEDITLRRARVSLSGEAAENLGYKFMIDSAANPTTTTDVLDMYLDFKHIQGLTVRVGQFVKPIGLELPQSPYGLDTINYSQMVSYTSVTTAATAIVPAVTAASSYLSTRDRGIAGIIDLNPVTVSLAFVNGRGNSTTGMADDNDNKYFIGRISGSPTEGLNLSGWGLTGKDPDYNAVGAKSGLANDKTNGFGADLTYKIKEFKLTGEYATTKTTDGPTSVALRTKEFYVAGVYNLTPMLQAVLRYDRFDPANTVSNDEVKVTTIGFNCNFAKNARFQLNYEIIKDSFGIAGANAKNNQLLAQVGVKFP